MKRIVSGLLLLAALAGVAWAQTGELRFPGDQFDRAAYRPTQATGNPRYEAILMDMREANFEALANYDAGDDVRRMAEPVGLLKVMLKGDQYITCTASVIDAGLILTNWHCLPKFGPEATKAALWMGFYSDDERGTVGYSVDLKPVETDRALDYAILKVSGDLSKWGRVRLAAEDPPANRSLAIVHHPAGRPKQLTQRSCRTADPALAKGELRHKCDTLEGSSGAPVFFGAGDAARMVALHFAGVPQSVRGVDPSLEANLAIPLSRIAQKSAVVKRLTAAVPNETPENVGSGANAPSPVPGAVSSSIPLWEGKSGDFHAEFMGCSTVQRRLECLLYVTASRGGGFRTTSNVSAMFDDDGISVPFRSITVGSERAARSERHSFVEVPDGVRTRVMLEFPAPAPGQIYSTFRFSTWASPQAVSIPLG